MRNEGLPEGPWGVVLADPPWSYGLDHRRGAAVRHYDTQPDAWIYDLPVRDVLADDALLVMWATWPKLAEALRVVDAWGFTLKTGAAWLKTTNGLHPHTGIGWWLRGCTEPILIGTRGKPRTPADPPLGLVEERVVSLPEQEPLLLTAPRREHSRKPTDIHRLAEALSADERRLELFARRPEPGWTCWGNELREEVAS